MVVLATACGGANESPETIDTRISSTVISFEFDPGISDDDKTLVEATIEDSRLFFAKELGRDLQLDITVKVTTDDGVTSGCPVRPHGIDLHGR